MSWIRRIALRNVRHIARLDVDLEPPPGAAFASLVLTGDNGAGKTSALEAIVGEIVHAIAGDEHPAAEVEAELARSPEAGPEERARRTRMAFLTRTTRLTWCADAATLARRFAEGDTVAAYVPAGDAPALVGEGDLAPRPPADPSVRLAGRLEAFLAARLAPPGATDEAELGERDETLRHGAWLASVRHALRELFGESELELGRGADGAVHLDLDRGRRRLALAQLPAGYRRVLGMWAELTLRADAPGARARPRGVLVVDAIEADLHPRLQRSLLPALAARFPDVQLVCATHSPLVVTSLETAMVVDVTHSHHETGRSLRERGLDGVLRWMDGDPAERRRSVVPSAPAPPRSPSVPPPPGVPVRALGRPKRRPRPTLDGPGDPPDPEG